MLPPSATLGLALRLTVVTSASSVTDVLTVAVVVSAPKPPPEVPAMPTFSVSTPWVYASSTRTSNGALSALLCPTGMVIVCPLVRVITSGLPVTGWSTAAV